MALVRWEPARDLATMECGDRKVDQNIRRDRYQRLERSYGSFSRSFTIPSTIDAGRIAASYKDGVLTVRLPQREEAKPKPIEVAD